MTSAAVGPAALATLGPEDLVMPLGSRQPGTSIARDRSFMLSSPMPGERTGARTAAEHRLPESGLVVEPPLRLWIGPQAHASPAGNLPVLHGGGDIRQGPVQPDC